MSLFWICLGIFFLVLLYIVLKPPKNPYYHADDFPRVKGGLPLIGNVHQFDPILSPHTFNEFHGLYGKNYVMNVFGLDVVSTIDPLLSKSICYDMNTWKRGDFGWKVDIEVFGGGVLFAIDGEEWKTRRKNLNKFFSSRNLLSYSSSIKEACSKMCNWINFQGTKLIDIDFLFTRVTLSVILIFLCGDDRGCIEESDESKVIISAFDDMAKEAYYRNGLPMFRYLPLPSRIKYLYSRNLYEVIYNIIKERKLALQNIKLENNNSFDGYEPTCLIDYLRMNNNILRGEDDKLIAIECIAMMFAGHDTTAHTLTWLLVETSRNDSINENIIKEISACRFESDNNDFLIYDNDQAKDIPYLKSVMNETLRLYPQATVHPCEALVDVNINGLKFKKGQVCFVNTYAMHRDPLYWSFVDSFMPERWSKGEPILPENSGLSASNVYFPFLQGPHTCIGMPLAQLELYIVTTSFFRNFDFVVHDSRSHKPRQMFTLVPDKPVKVSCSKKSTS